jgi:hypothetical protein
MPPIVENLSVDIQHNIQKLCFFSRIEDLDVTPIVFAECRLAEVRSPLDLIDTSHLER